MISKIFLYTNRNAIFFDENGEQIHEYQKNVNCNTADRRYIETDVLKIVVQQKPVVFMCRWNEWIHEISVDEFCYILGYGSWYYDYKKELKNDADTTKLDI